MKFIADLHIHSKYSRATSKNLDLENLYIAGQLKGITVLATGDVTHPDWFSELKEKLVPAEAGLYKLREDIARACDLHVPETCRGPIRFVLVSEISNIYKKNDKTRKNHNLVFFPDIETVEQFNQKLDAIGNIQSDGRPILGLDARDLLEICLETSQESFLVPAHIWTPWFSMLGSKSGFDTIQECFEDLTPYIFAVETGLSSDPEMNWRVKNLDGLTLLSNSDAHSPMKLGREANIFDTELNYYAIKKAIQTGNPAHFRGTLEFFPEEGKYHIDGHRKCDYRSWPVDTIQKNGTCPVCGKAMTLGVLYRVEQLADRPLGQKPEKHHPYHHLVPLQDILSELLGVGPNSKTVQRAYQGLLKKKGPEFGILQQLPLSRLNHTEVPLLVEAIERVRDRRVHISPGYDGAFGTIRLFTPEEKEKRSNQKRLFALMTEGTAPCKRSPPKAAKIPKKNRKSVLTKRPTRLNIQQKAVIHHQRGPIIIVAGPGTGKTLTITHRIGHLILKRGIPAHQILGLTFTNQAAGEMLERLKRLLPAKNGLPWVGTFHSFCLNILAQRLNKQDVRMIDDREKIDVIKDAKNMVTSSGLSVSWDISWLASSIARVKQEILTQQGGFLNLPPAEAQTFFAVFQAYQRILHVQDQLDYEDLIHDVVKLFESNGAVREKVNKQYPFVFVDEYQDINTAQYRLLRAMSNPEKDICVIGDPDQSIYGFRGSNVAYFHQFLDDYPGAVRIQLAQNYRSTQTILSASQKMIQKSRGREASRVPLYSQSDSAQKVGILACNSEKHEAVTIGQTIESMVGGLGFYSIDFGKTEEAVNAKDRTFSDFAILYRTARQGDVLVDILSASGIPCQVAAKTTSTFSPELLALVSCLKLLNHSGSFYDLSCILTYLERGLGAKTIAGLKQWAYSHDYHLYQAFDHLMEIPKQQVDKIRKKTLGEWAQRFFALIQDIKDMTITDAIQAILARLPSQSRQKINDRYAEQLERLMKLTGPYGKNVGSFFQNQALQTAADSYDSLVEKVTLMSMHASKGLEFPVVFVAGCEDGLIPFKRSAKRDVDDNEERRLFYVAMTRAKEVLFLTYACKRKIHGKIQARTVSPFVADVESQLKRMNEERKKQGPPKRQTQLDLFSE